MVFNPQIALCTLDFIHALEPLERVPNEGQCHVCGLLIVKGLCLSTDYGRIIVLIDIVDGEIGHVSGRVETWLKGSAYRAEAIPVDTMEKGMRFDFDAAAWTALGAETVLNVAKHAIRGLSARDMIEGG